MIHSPALHQNNIDGVLKKLEKLLRCYDFIIEANTVAGAIELYKINQQKAYEQISSESWWVGKDAVAEADLSIAGGFTPNARQEQQQLQQLFIDLYQHLTTAGYKSEYARIVTQQYQKWQVSGMLK